MTKAVKATRKLSEFNFDYEGAAVALVGPSVGGAANGRTTLLTKSLKDISETEVEKASMVTVTLSITEYLRRFFDLWYEDAEVLARIMGMDTREEHVDGNMQSYDEYLDSKVAAVSIMKSLVLDKDELKIAKSVSELNPKDYLVILKSQEQFEKNFEVVSSEASLKKSSGLPAKGVTVSKETTSPAGKINKNQEDDTLSDFITKAAHEEAVTKAVEEAIAKALAPVQEELQKAKEQLEAVEVEKQEVVSKSRKEAVASVEKDAAKAEELFKSLESLAQEAFDVVIKSLKAKDEVVENSDLFVQKSRDSDVEIDEENGTAALLKAKYNK